MPKMDTVVPAPPPLARMLQFLIVTSVAPAFAPELETHTAAVRVAAFVFVIDRLRSVPPLFEPSMVTKASLTRIILLADEPLIVAVVLVSGLMVMVLVAFE